MQTTEYGKKRRCAAHYARLPAVLAAVLVLGGCRQASALTLNGAEPASQEQEQKMPAEATPEDAQPVRETETPPVKQISVHVCGAVKCAGVYVVAEDARVIDAVNAAGGFAEDACTEAVNQAAFLVDGCRLRIPFVSETDGTTPETEIPVMTVGTDAQPADGLVVLADGIAERDGKVNINTASAEELCTLNGIGPKRASDIIRYREEHGAFANIEDVMNVNGIKESLFAQIREYIRV